MAVIQNVERDEALLNALRKMVHREVGHSTSDAQLGGGAYSATWLEYALSLPEYIGPEDAPNQDPTTGEIGFQMDIHAVGDAPLL